jgi:ribose-phosphate pyrophosphokinase
VATHSLFVGDAADNLCDGWFDRVVTTDTVRGDVVTCIPIERVSVAPLIADAVERLHRDQSLEGLLAYR